MKDGFVKVAVASPKLKVADCAYNGTETIRMIEEAEAAGVKLLVFPELGITGYTLADLVLQDTLLDNAKETLKQIVEATAGKDVFVFVGLPLMVKDKLYNVAAALQNGELLGFVPKHNIPTYSEFYEGRHYRGGKGEVTDIPFDGQFVPFGMNLLFTCEALGMTIAAEICEDLWTAIPPSSHHALAGANVLVNLSASNETTGKDVYRRELVKSQSARLYAAYLYACSGEGESTTDLVFAAHNLIAESGTILAESERFFPNMQITEIDLKRLRSERRRVGCFESQENEAYTEIFFTYPSMKNGMPETVLTRTIDKTPFVPQNQSERNKRAGEITMIQAMGLKKRLSHTGCKTAVLGISGGLDSTLALLITCKAFDLLGLDRSGVISVTMPCFGTTDRTYQNAVTLAKELKTTLLEVPIAEAVKVHFRDIGQDEAVHDVTYENAQARERTQVIMDIANRMGGMVVGTGDMSELALGWATYNGDHMSMYGVNASIPKTLVRYLVKYFAEEQPGTTLERVLSDILDTPVSPELLPPTDGEISQKTEDLVGPYELHDFFLYYVLRFGCRPEKVYRLAKKAFAGEYEPEVILHWLKTFYRRFFSQQFKRSCLPDGPKVGSVALSPRGDLRMPSDACAREWLNALETIR
ncbi:MAG: NAD(+) synthase [Lachnospiraceae bacterium]